MTYPSDYDEFPKILPHPFRELAGEHNKVAAAVEAIEAEVGKTTETSTATVRGKLTDHIADHPGGGGGTHPGLASHDGMGLATDAELSAHAAAADPHTGYQKESEKGAANGYAGLGAGGLVPMAQLASGTPDGTKYVRDDGTLQVPSGGGAPPDASYVTMDAEAGLSAESVLGTAVIMAGTHASRPAASKAGRLYRSTDLGAVSRDDGAAWAFIHSLSPYYAVVSKVGTNFIAVRYDGVELAYGTNPRSVSQAAIDDASGGTQLGASVRWRAHSYQFTDNIALIWKSKVHGEGEGTWGRNSDGGNIQPYGALFKAVASATVPVIDVPASTWGAYLENFGISGNAKAATYGLRSGTGDAKYEHLGIYDCQVGLGFITSAFDLAPEADDFMIQGCDIGLDIASGVTDGFISKFRILESATISMNIDGSGWLIQHGHVTTKASGATVGLDLTASNSHFVNIYFDAHRNGRHANLGGANNIIDACEFYGVDSAGGGQPHILLNASKQQIVNCLFRSQSEAKAWVKFGVAVANAIIGPNRGHADTGSPNWIAPIIDSSDAAVGATDTSNCWIQGNKVEVS